MQLFVSKSPIFLGKTLENLRALPHLQNVFEILGHISDMFGYTKIAQYTLQNKNLLHMNWTHKFHVRFPPYSCTHNMKNGP